MAEASGEPAGIEPGTSGEVARLEEFRQFCIDHPGPAATRFYADRMDRADRGAGR